MTVMTDLDKLAKSLTKAQREALVDCIPWDVEVGAGIAIAFCAYGFLQESSICDCGVELTPQALALRAHLKGQSDEQ